MHELNHTDGRPWPLGATLNGDGVNFALFSEHATSVTLCLFSADGSEELRQIPLTARLGDIWYGRLGGVGAGLVYGYRVDGPHEVERGHRFDKAKLLLDPYARRIVGQCRLTDRPAPGIDNARDIFKAAVTGPDDFDWGDDRPPDIAADQTVLYEAHVKGLTQRHPEVPAELRGRFEGVAADAVIAHLQRLGVTALELMPVQESLSERGLLQRGLVNYWGYNPIGFFAPDRRFAREDPVREFKTMVKRLHAAGIEVILDVVYNHTAEGDHTGPVVSMKGIDNAAYYHLKVGHANSYENFSGTGNALNLRHPRVLQMVMDSLRFWAGEMHVDGFRFDLATTLGRGPTGFDPRSSFFDCMRQDPLLARVKLIAEPWDVGFNGYQVGRFPAGWREWNDRFRDSVRSFWVRKAGYRGELATRLAGSSELFQHDQRRPQAGVNFIASHDGFTLQDLVSYDYRHNQANGEAGRDGLSENFSWNCGAEGPTELLAVNALRGRLKRALLASLFVSQGTPMLLAGDEMGRTQGGNNNAYCQDSEMSWIDWAAAADPLNQQLVEFVSRLIGLRKRYPQLRRTQWLSGEILARGRKDVLWLNRQGGEMNQRQWEEWGRYAFGFVLGAASAEEAHLLVLLNAEASDWTTPLPEGRWRAVLDSARPVGEPEAGDSIEASVTVRGRTLLLLEDPPAERGGA
jgi:glycogen debranching enzyme GlgX